MVSPIDAKAKELEPRLRAAKRAMFDGEEDDWKAGALAIDEAADLITAQAARIAEQADTIMALETLVYSSDDPTVPWMDKFRAAEAEVRTLREALEPFANYLGPIPEPGPAGTLIAADFRAAAAALRAKEP